MKQLAILVFAFCAIALFTADANAQHYRYGHPGRFHGHHHHHYHGCNRGGGGFAIGIGSPYYGVGYSSFRPVYGGGFYPAVPVAPVHPWGGGYYGRGYGCHRGGGAIVIGF